MSSGFSGGDFFSLNGRSTNMNNTTPTTTNNPFIFHPNTLLNNNPQQQQQYQQQGQQFPFRSPLSGLLPDPSAQIRRPDFIGKRSLSDYQQSQQNLAFYLRNVKQRSNSSYNQQPSPISTLSPVDYSPVPSNSSSSLSSGGGYGVPILHQNNRFSNIPRNVVNNVFSLPQQSNKPYWNNPNSNSNPGPMLPGPVQVQVQENQMEKKAAMDNHLLELEKQLLGDEEEEENGETVSVVTNAHSEWSETIQTLMKSPTRNNNQSNNPVTPSPTSSSSSCSSTSASPPVCLKQSMIDAATAVCDGKPEVASEILTRLQQVANSLGSSEQRLACYMVSALKSRVSCTDERSSSLAELHGKEHSFSTQMLYDVSPCFKLGFMAANLAMLEATSENGFSKIHVVDFDIGQGGQYVHLLHALAAANKGIEVKTSLRITTVSGFSIIGEEKMRAIGDGLKSLAQKIGVCFSFGVKNLSFNELSREKLEVQREEALVVNFAFKLYKLPDESVTTENLRDELLRRVKGLSPVVMTVVEQEMNCNTAPLTTRVRDAWDHYGALFDSLDKTIARDNSDRVKIEEGLGRKLANSVACEGRERVERCEVFGKWRARMSMAGFKPSQMSQLVSESLKLKLNSGTRGNPGFSVNEQSGGICFGWMGRTITVASAWR